MSRYLSGKRGDTDINEEQPLKGQIIRNDLWDIKILKDEEKFQNEIYSLTFDLKVSQTYEFYEILGGDPFDYFDLQNNSNEIIENSKNENINLNNEIKQENIIVNEDNKIVKND